MILITNCICKNKEEYEKIRKGNIFGFSGQRLFALWYKELCQIARDPSSIFMAAVMPLIMMLIFGYGISFDTNNLRIGIVLEEQSPEARRFAQAFSASPFIEATVSASRAELARRMQAGLLRGIVVLPVNFSRRLADTNDTAPIQVITDGSEPNTANFVQAYTQGVWQTWMNNKAQDEGNTPPLPLEVEVRYRFNPSAESKNFIVPGAITIVMTVVGAVLTSLVIAREWERGTMEALLSTRMTKAELILSKLVPYYFLGMCSFLFCLCLGVLLIGVPFRGSALLLMALSSLFLLNTLGMGLLISTITKNQFNASQVALNAAFLPAIMLSGFVFEIDSMPALVQAFTYIIPARYYVSSMQTLFLAGNIPSVLITNAFFLLVTGALFLGATALKTHLRLE